MEGIEIIRYSPILQDAFRYIIEHSTSNYMPYHNLNHLLTVLKYSDYIATSMILVQLLPKKQLHIYKKLGEGYVTAKELADKAKIHTKEVSPNVKQMNAQGTLVIIKKFGYTTKYKKA